MDIKIDLSQYKTITNQVIKQGDCNKLNADWNNCTVLALAATTGSSYDHAYEIAKKDWKRKHGDGVKTSMLDQYFFNNSIPRVDTVKVYDCNKKKGTTIACNMTVGTFAKEHPIGSYYVLVYGHALAIVNGQILDHSHFIPKKKRILKRVWKIK